MRHFHFLIIAFWLIVTGGPSPTFAGEAPQPAECVLPKFGDDREAIIKTCSLLLERSDLSDIERARLLTIRGRASHMSHNVHAAIRDFEVAMALNPNDTIPRVRRGMAALTKREFDTTALDDRAVQDAIGFAEQAIAIDPNCAEAYELVGAALAMSGDPRFALAAYNKAVELKPNSTHIRIFRYYFFKKVGANAAALKELDEIEKINAPDLDTGLTTLRNKEMSDRTLVRLERATLLQNTGRFEEAENSFSHWTEIEPGAVSYGWRAWFYLDRQKFDLAQADLEKALSYDPNFWLLHNLLGHVYFYKNDHAHAVEEFDLAIAQFPKSGLNFWGRALALRALKRTDDAISDAVKAVEIDPDFPNRIISRVRKAGYYFPVVTKKTDNMPALREAVRACMIDERC